jgi:hypothetical protein
MTVLSNHRLHSYKASAATHNRDILPKKREAKPLNKIHLRKRSSSPPKKYLKLQTIPQNPPPSPVLSIMTEEERIITVWGEEYRIQLPSGYDIYDGLRRWYPSLYEAVIQEEKLEKMESSVEEYEMELAWDHQDYLEWLFD